MTKNFPKLSSNTKPQIQESYRTSSMINAKKKKKKNYQKTPDGKNKHLIYKGTNTRIAFDISSETVNKKSVLK